MLWLRKQLVLVRAASMLVDPSFPIFEFLLFLIEDDDNNRSPLRIKMFIHYEWSSKWFWKMSILKNTVRILDFFYAAKINSPFNSIFLGKFLKIHLTLYLSGFVGL